MEKNIIITKNVTKFDEMLNTSINEILHEILGEKGAKSVYYFAENGYGIPKNELAQNIQKFQGMLNDMFKVGAVLLEQKIMEKIFSKIKATKKDIMLDYKDFDELDFLNYINSLKAEFNSKSNNITA